MTRTRTAQVGTVSHGTLRTEDLLKSFALELGWLSGPDRTTEETAAIAKAGEVEPDTDEGYDALNNLHDLLDAFAPEGFYFGAHEGDGSDFGFWPIEDLT